MPPHKIIEPSTLKIIIDSCFSAKLIDVIQRLVDDDFGVKVTISEMPVADFPCNIVNIHVYKENISFDEVYRCVMPLLFLEDSEIIKNRYDSLADTILAGVYYRPSHTIIDNSNPFANTLVGPKEQMFFKAIAEELASRGDFSIDIPKLVDVLFKLGVVIPTEDVESNKDTEIMEV